MAEPIAVRLPPLDELARRWPEIEVILARATRRSRCYEPIDILRLVMGGNTGWAIWLVTRDDAVLAVAVTHVEQFPRLRVCNVPFIAGNELRLWHEPLLAELDRFGRAAGCACLAGYDRKGWSRFGFQIGGAVMLREL